MSRFIRTKQENLNDMKKKKTTKNNAAGASVRRVHLEFNHATATAVCIAGSFNEWRPAATPMVSLGDGRWLKELVLAPGIYEYRLVVDGEWMPDPLGRETSPNPFGGLNSVLKVNE
jgi:1,4-alpha-glucan branching enzyme